MAYKRTKFEDPSFSHSIDMKEDPKGENKDNFEGDWGHLI